MEFFDKLGKKASEAYKVTADKTGKIAREAKLKMKMADLKSQANDIYEEIGKKIYEKNRADYISDENTQVSIYQNIKYILLLIMYYLIFY